MDELEPGSTVIRASAADRRRHRDRLARCDARADRRHLAEHRGRAKAAYIPLRHSYAGAPDQLPLDAVLARAAALARGRGRAQARPEHQVRHARLRQRRHRRCAATRTTRCCRATCSRRTSRTAWKAWRAPPRPHGPELRGRRAARARTRSRSRRSTSTRAAEYSCEDSEMTLHVHEVLWPQIEAERRAARRLRDDRDADLGDPRAHRAPRRADRRRAARAPEPANSPSAWSRSSSEAHELAGQPFNLGSPKQIGEILFGKLGLPVKKKTASGAPSTDEEVLDELAADYPLPAKLLEHRSLSKLKGTYTDKLPLMVNPQTGRVHTNYAQAVAVTGRLSSNDPNLQNIPIRTAEGRRVREAFIAPPGHQILSAPTTRRSSCASWPTSAATRACCRPSPTAWTCTAPPPARCSRSSRCRHVRAAALCQDDQLRPDLRHGRVRPGAQPGHRAQRRERPTSSATSSASPA